MARYKEKSIRLAVLSIGVGAMFIASFALPTNLGLAATLITPLILMN